MKRLFIAISAIAFLAACQKSALPPDQYGTVTRVRSVVIKDPDSNDSFNVGSCGSSAACGVIQLGLILVYAGAAVADEFSAPHLRAGTLYDVSLPGGESQQLLADKEEALPALRPGQWVQLHYGEKKQIDQHCFKPMGMNAQGAFILQIEPCHFTQKDADSD